MNSPDVWPDTTINRKAEKFWLFHSLSDSMINVDMFDSTIQVYSSSSFNSVGFTDQMYESGMGYQVLIADYKTQLVNPYLQRTHYACWALWSDYYIEYDSVQLWFFYTWVKLFDWQDFMEFKYKYINPIFESDTTFPRED